MGTKRHVLIEQRDIPVSIVIIRSVNKHNVKAATDTLDSVVVKRSLKKQNLCLDRGTTF